MTGQRRRAAFFNRSLSRPAALLSFTANEKPLLFHIFNANTKTTNFNILFLRGYFHENLF